MQLQTRLLLAILFGGLCTTSVAEADSTTTTNLGLRFDCTHHFNRNKGAKQDCISVSGLRLSVLEKPDEKVSALLVVDPFATTAVHYDAAPTRSTSPQVQDTPLSFIDYYSLTWYARPNINVSIEDFRGSTNLPRVSGLTFEGSLEDTPWEQTAISLNYGIPVLKDLNIKVSLGNGEGENNGNVDAQQFVGLRLGIGIMEGLQLSLATSFDGNNMGSGAYELTYAPGFTTTTPPNLAFQTQRYLASLELDGKSFGTQGLRLAAGWQRTSLTDLDKKTDAVPAGLIVSDPGVLLVEDPTKLKTNTVTKDVVLFGAYYKILATYFVGLNYQLRMIDAGDVEAFERCTAIGTITCTQAGTKDSQLNQTALGFGAGMDLHKNLVLTVEYYRQSYDDLYAVFHYVDPSGKASETLELFNARIAYRWD